MDERFKDILAGIDPGDGELDGEATEPEGDLSLDALMAAMSAHERIAVLENVLVAVIKIVSENANSPSFMADELTKLLAQPEEQAAPEEG